MTVHDESLYGLALIGQTKSKTMNTFKILHLGTVRRRAE